MSGPTAYPDLNDVLREFLESVQAILGDNFHGAYLQGSFALGDADEHSDIDFIVATHDEVTATQLEGLQAMHNRLYGLESTWAQHLEGSYVPKRELRRVDESRAPYWYLDNCATELVEDNHCNTAVGRWAGKWVLRTLDARWSSLIRDALDDRPDPWAKVHQEPDPDAVDRTLAFLDYALNETSVRIEPWGKDDKPILEQALGDPQMMTYLGGEPETPEKIAKRQARYEKPDSRQYKIVDEATGEGVGWVGYWERPAGDEQVFEVGWSVLPAFQGRGVATKATALVIEKAKAEQRLRYMHAWPSVENAPSNAICRKLGFTLVEAEEFEYPPGSGKVMTCNDWRLDLTA